MRRGTRTFAVGLVVVLGLALSNVVARPGGAEEARAAAVRIGLIGTLFRDTPEPIVQVMVKPFKSLLESQTGVTGQVMVGGDAESLGQQLKDDKIQLGVFHGIELAWARQKNPSLKPLLIAVNRHRFLRALLVVRQDSKAACCGDLQGQALAMPRLSREHCRLFLERRCCKADETLENSFKPLTITIDPEEALDAVVDGTARAAVVDEVELEAYQKLKPGRYAKLKKLLESERFPCAVVAYNDGRLPESQLKMFRDGMIASKNNRRGKDLLELCRITGFEAIPADYEQTLTDIVKAYPLPAPAK
jgi:ABC-type phosphate/phosphonate transport system substrate-binding protein